MFSEVALAIVNPPHAPHISGPGSWMEWDELGQRVATEGTIILKKRERRAPGKIKQVSRDRGKPWEAPVPAEEEEGSLKNCRRGEMGKETLEIGNLGQNNFNRCQARLGARVNTRASNYRWVFKSLGQSRKKREMAEEGLERWQHCRVGDVRSDQWGWGWGEEAGKWGCNNPQCTRWCWERVNIRKPWDSEEQGVMRTAD